MNVPFVFQNRLTPLSYFPKFAIALDLITADLDDEYKENYYAQGVISDAPDLFLKVCVLFKQDVGRVLTAFEVAAPRMTEDVLWQK